MASLTPEAPIFEAMKSIGFSQRPGEWNLRDHIPPWWRGSPADWDKLVFGPPPEERPSNVHVRVQGRPNERYALLFRDYLRSNHEARQIWGEFKTQLAARFPDDLSSYGTLKTPPTDLLVLVAQQALGATV